MRSQYPSNIQDQWVGPFRWTPRWFPYSTEYEARETEDGLDTINYSEFEFTDLPITAVLTSVPTPSASGLYGLFECFAYQLNELAFQTEITKHNIASYADNFPSRVFIVPDAKSDSTVSILTDGGYVELPRFRTLWDALYQPHAGWYYENGTAIITGVGVTEFNTVQSKGKTIMADTKRDVNLPVWFQHYNGRFVIYPSSRIGQRGSVPVRNPDRVRYFLNMTIASVQVKVDQTIVTAEAYDLTDRTDEGAFIWNMPFQGQQTSKTKLLAVQQFTKNQTTKSVQAGIGITFNQYESGTLSDGDSASGSWLLSEPRYSKKTDRQYGDRILVEDPVNLIGFYRGDATDISVQDGVIQEDVETDSIIYLKDRLTETYRGEAVEYLVSEVTIQTISSTDLVFKWNQLYADQYKEGNGTFI